MAYKPTTEKERILHRLKIAQGHLHKIISMVDDDQYCIDVLHQSDAVQKALQNVDSIILENHLKTCTANAISEGRTEEAIAEVMNVFKNKR